MALEGGLAVVQFLLIRQVVAKYCLYQSGDGYNKYYCSPNDYCCDTGCCEHHVMFGNFYRLWYFWFCVLLALLFCSGGGYWYKRRYIHQRFIFGQSPAAPGVVTMTANSTSSADGTCSRIPTGMTFNSNCCHANGYSGQTYTVAPGYGNAYAGQGIVQITPKGTVYYHAPPCNLPPSYESVFRIDTQGNPIPILEQGESTLGSEMEPDIIRTTRTRQAWPAHEPVRTQQVMCVSAQHQQPIRTSHSTSPVHSHRCGCASMRPSRHEFE